MARDSRVTPPSLVALAEAAAARKSANAAYDAAIIEAYKAGMSLAAIGRAAGVTAQTVHYYLTRVRNT